MPLSLDQPPMQSMTLPDGRRLAWYEYGDPNGVPCIYTTGTPASGLTGIMYDELARDAGVRFISLDKPGYGHSDYYPERQLTHWPNDVSAVADHLGFDRFAVMGESGGGPHVLALAHGIPERITIALAVAGMGPGHESWVREGMKPMNRRLFWLAQRAPWLLQFALRSMARSLKSPQRREKWIAQQLSAAPEADRALMEREPNLTALTLDAFFDAFRDGAQGATQEMRLFGRPWGFDLKDISIPVHVWHGTEDVNVPVAVARRVAQEIPKAEAHIIEGAGHTLSFDHGEAMMRQITEAANGTT